MSAFLSLVLSSMASAQVSVVSTIRPLQFIAQAILMSDDEAYAIESDSHSAHSITLSPQDRVQIANADIVLWISPQFEIYLADLLNSTERTQPVILAAEIPQITLHTMANGEMDPHLWLDPNNALVIARQLADELARIAPDRAENYQAKFSEFETRINGFWNEVDSSLNLPNPAPYAVYHDAYRYWEEGLGISHSAVLLDNPEVEPGMRDVIAKRRELEALQPRCILMEPDSSPELVDTMLDRLEPRRIILDLLGTNIFPDADAYVQLLNHVADGFRDCVSAN